MNSFDRQTEHTQSSTERLLQEINSAPEQHNNTVLKSALANQPEKSAGIEAAVSESRAKRSDSQIDLDSSGHVKRIVRPDDSQDVFDYDGDKLIRLNRTDASGALSIWEAKSAGLPNSANLVRWTSTQAPDDMMINLHVAKTGIVSFEEIQGSTVNDLPDGSMLRENINGSRVTLNPDSKIKQLQKSNGERIDVERDDNDKPVKYTVYDGKEKTEWVRSSKDQWTNNKNSELRSNFHLTENGVETFISNNHGRVTQIEYPDGSSRSFTYSGDKVKSVAEHSLEQRKDTTWTRAGNSDMWKSAGVAEKRMAVSVSQSGDYSYIGSDSLKHTFKLDESEILTRPGVEHHSAEVISASTKLEHKAAEQIKDSARLENFKTDLVQFKQQAQGRGLSEDVIAKSIKEVDALLTAKPNSYLAAPDRVALAEQIMHNLGDPHTTDQGSHNTCGATAAEVVLSAKFPDKLVNMLVQIADSGEYRTTLGMLVKPSTQSLKPDSEAKEFDPYSADSEGVRSYAAQLIQTVGIDTIYTAQKLNQLYEAKDDQEYVVKNDSGKTKSFDGLEDPDVEQMLKHISGVELKAYSKDKQFDSAESLQKVLHQLKDKHSLPVVFSVDILKNGPFLDQYREDRSGLEDGGHYVTVWDIDANNNVLVDDQFGRENDFESLRRVPVANLFQTSMPVQTEPVAHEPFRYHHLHRLQNPSVE